VQSTKQKQHSHTAGLIQLRNMKAQILKSMIVDGRKLVAGDIVEVKGWRHAKSLANNRYIKLIEEDVVEEVAEASKPKATKKTKEVAE
jgi:hypothetical protein